MYSTRYVAPPKQKPESRRKNLQERARMMGRAKSHRRILNSVRSLIAPHHDLHLHYPKRWTRSSGATANRARASPRFQPPHSQITMANFARYPTSASRQAVCHQRQQAPRLSTYNESRLERFGNRFRFADNGACEVKDIRKDEGEGAEPT